MFHTSQAKRMALYVGVSVLLLFVGFFTHNYFAEAVIYSIHLENNATDIHGGYYGQALQVATFGVFSLFAPFLVYYFSSMVAIAVSSVCFTMFFAGFLHFNHLYYYISQGVVGAGSAIFHVAEGVYLSEISPDDSYGYIVAFETTISHSGQLLGGIIMFIITFGSRLVQDEPTFGLDMGFIKGMYAAFTICCLVSLMLFIFFPWNKAQNEHNWAMNIIKHHIDKKCELLERIYIILKVMFMRPAITMWNASLYQGAFTSFFLTVYPAVFVFDKRFSSPKYMVALYSSSIGVGVIIAGLFMTKFAKKYHDIALQWGFYLHSICMVATISCVAVFTPTWAFVGPSNGQSLLWISGSLQTALVGIFAGMGDCFLSTFRKVVCHGATEKNAAEMFAITRFFQAISGGFTLLITPYLSVFAWIGILSGLMFLSFFGVVQLTVELAQQEVRNSLGVIASSISGKSRRSPSAVVVD